MSIKTGKQGRLVIFFSYCRQVDKIQPLCKAGQAAARQGRRVVFFSGKQELPQGVAPMAVSRHFSYGQSLEEPDLDQTLADRPDIILLDDPGHLNAEGCRHQWRYQDIEELTRAGITVYTTLDVDRLESLSDAVSPALERWPSGVPDKFFDDADEVIYVDAPIDSLPDPDPSLAPLRRLAMQRMADRSQRRDIPDGSTRAESILMCLSPSPSNAKVIRTAARMAQAFHGSFTALFVEGGSSRDLNPDDSRRLSQNLRLAEQLGARITTVYGDDPAVQIAEYAKAGGFTRIVVGRTNSQGLLAEKSLADRMAQLAPDLDIYIIPDNRATHFKKASSPRRAPLFSFSDLLKSLIVIGAASAIGHVFYSLGMKDADIITVYLLGVLLTAIWTKGRLNSVFSAFLSVVVFNFLFTEPRFTLFAYDAGYPVTFLIMLASGIITSSLATRIKVQAKQAAGKAYRTETLLETSRLLQKAQSQEDILHYTAVQLSKLLERPIIFYDAPLDDGSGPLMCCPAPLPYDQYASTLELRVAKWVCDNNKHAGATTDTFPTANCLYFAVRGRTDVLAVAAIPIKGYSLPASFEKSLMVAILDECGLALDKERLIREKQQAEMAAEQESLRSNLLRAISHDLRTPLTSIMGSAAILTDGNSSLDPDRRQSLCEGIYDDSMWLISLVENLLSVTRLENGAIDLNPQPELLEEVFEEALSHLDRAASNHNISWRLSDDMLMAFMDVRLIVQVIINLVNNAIKYTHNGSDIVLSADRQGENAVISVADNGGGVPDSEKEKLFEMFYTMNNAHGDGRRGMGLLLARCKAIVTAHGGHITVGDNSPKGTVFTFTLKVAEVTSNEQA